jgi:hypothetical protein
LEHLDGDQVGLCRSRLASPRVTVHPIVEWCAKYFRKRPTYLLRNSISGASDGSSNVGTVAESISVRSSNRVEAKGRSSAKLGVRHNDTAVNNVGIGALSSGSVIDVAGRCSRAVGDGAQAPSRAGLCGQRSGSELVLDLRLVPKIRDRIRLNKLNLTGGIRLDQRRHSSAVLTSGLALISATVASSNSPA